MNLPCPPLTAVLCERKNEIVGEWLARTLEPYSESTRRFLAQERDCFRNPTGHTLREGLSVLFDGLMRQTETADLAPALDGIVRIRAVQDLAASRALAFLFVLKQIVRHALKSEAARYSEELRTLESRIDEMAGLAFDIYTSCRQQICELRTKELRHRVPVMKLERWLAEEESIG